MEFKMLKNLWTRSTNFKYIFDYLTILATFYLFSPLEDISYTIEIMKHEKRGKDRNEYLFEVCGSFHGIQTYNEIYGMNKWKTNFNSYTIILQYIL